MTRQNVAMASSLLLLLFVAIALWLGSLLPAHTALPVHWGLDGQVRVFAGKWTALVLPPFLILVNSLFFYALPAIEPRRTGLERSQGLYFICWISVLLCHLSRELALVAHALSWTIAIDRLLIGSIGFMLALIGDQLSKSRSMLLIGIVTPWTLASEEVWIRTHRLAGRLMSLGGVAIIAAALVALPSQWLRALVLAVLITAALAPTLYSYRIRPGRESAISAPPIPLTNDDIRWTGLWAYVGIAALLLLLGGQILGLVSDVCSDRGDCNDLFRAYLRMVGDGFPYIFGH